ncbi:cytochrome P450 6k1-like isoform X2 [Diabrotica virgifera virgifera]|nr:cytochrome P450 6k1-like isoform X2 [Diabrotica virgifera virgifera]XP_050513920.1 cytochrome P450 6k1-like isoform X2 [Diabrotica virgifera virgifera]XP_050513921.1 cytochrome P450 6k1-like isoform X2 [Diabrotica virgifera virgifera]XP_050513922.1 cytochrome P450 6k1-like isoform X2 [Diabrotica virgifera virgifera]
MLLTSSPFLDGLIYLSILCIAAYCYATRDFNYWKRRNVQFLKPVPFFGNLYDVMMFKTTTQECIKKIWDGINAPYFGMFIFDEPVLVLKSPKLIKDVLIKDASTFCNRRVATPSHPNMAHGMFFLKYNEWRKVRKMLSPVFTSGMLRYLQPHTIEINQTMLDFVHKNCGIFDVTNIGEDFAIEFLVRCFYEANPRCFNEKPSVFKKCIHTMFAFNFRNGVVQNLFFLKPALADALKLNFVAKNCMKFFEDVFKRIMTARESYDGKPRSMVDVANKAIREKKRGEKDALGFETIMSNVLLFLIAGRDSTTTIISFTLYEIAKNQEIQDKLRKEVKLNVEKHGSICFEGVQENKYLEMCINETLRKYPTLPFLDRTPIDDYQFKDTDLKVEKNTSILIPLFALNRDEHIYPNATLYNPDRFLSDQINSDGLNFIPFGEGPRICIGKRIGLLAVSMALSTLVLNFSFQTCKDTPKEIEFETKSFALTSKHGLFLDISPIQE